MKSAAFFILVTSVSAMAADAVPRCQPVGGTISTNFGGVDVQTTLGPATGDLGGSVACTVLSQPTPGAGGVFSIAIQNHWVTASGDTIELERSVATAAQPTPGLFAILSYPVRVKGGTGRFSGATGELSLDSGVVDFRSPAGGRAVFRYDGKICSPSW